MKSGQTFNFGILKKFIPIYFPKEVFVFTADFTIRFEGRELQAIAWEIHEGYETQTSNKADKTLKLLCAFQDLTVTKVRNAKRKSTAPAKRLENIPDAWIYKKRKQRSN